ncbi:MAG: response regulator transcription factor [Cohnella sp.]|nr:response regulator transcription factor [Cohnella sp.]
MKLIAELLPIFEGALPSCIVTNSALGIPNIANLTRVWHHESDVVAVANQLLNKTYRNLMENPMALLKIINPYDRVHWEISVRYLRSESEGPLFERVRQDLMTVAWVTGAESVAELRSVLLFETAAVRRCAEESFPLRPITETYGDMLKALAGVHGWERLSYWIPEENEPEVRLLASLGVPGAGADDGAFGYMKRLATLALKENRTIRLNNIRSQRRYLHSMERSKPMDVRATDEAPAGYLALPVRSFRTIVGVVCYEDADGKPADRYAADDRYLELLAAKLGETMFMISSVTGEEREAVFKQAIAHAKLLWEKESEPFHTSLSARERQVAVTVAQGCTNSEIANKLFISPRTVTTHLERIYQKLNVPSRAALTRYVMEKGLADSQE